VGQSAGDAFAQNSVSSLGNNFSHAAGDGFGDHAISGVLVSLGALQEVCQQLSLLDAEDAFITQETVGEAVHDLACGH
jgi:hypothetical protein